MITRAEIYGTLSILIKNLSILVGLIDLPESFELNYRYLERGVTHSRPCWKNWKVRLLIMIGARTP